MVADFIPLPTAVILLAALLIIPGCGLWDLDADLAGEPDADLAGEPDYDLCGEPDADLAGDGEPPLGGA